MKKLILTAAFLVFTSFSWGQKIPKPFEEDRKVQHNPWELIIYRPDNSEGLNDVRCFIKIEDAESSEDVSHTKISAKYEWVSMTMVNKGKSRRTDFESLFVPGRISVLYEYQKSYYLSGGMAAHLHLQKGKYKITVSTPKDQHTFFKTSNKNEWTSNEFIYDTDNPLKVIFVSPTANKNGFYNGGWHISAKAPLFYEVTKPFISDESLQ
ncbi:hypothetical protein [Treponema sp.]|uniref:hypothetical protein n=1 Tax=Treponema sp. TaxID=166 RepID=UPI0025E0E397|nr:hypothetical protein [Treponema sp.]MCR5217414.1 hypothetical protein [Treponema sp.]